jgi:hypothetical protein
MEQIRNTNKTLEQTWMEETHSEICVIISLCTCQKSKKQNLVFFLGFRYRASSIDYK